MRTWQNLTQDGRVKRSKHCAIGSLFIAVIFLICGIMIYVHASHLKSVCISSTEGNVISVFPSGKYRWQAYLTADYWVNNTKYHTTGRYHSDTLLDDYSARNVIVHYDPSNPDTAFAGYAPVTSSAIILFVLACVFAIGVPLFVRQASVIQKHMQIRPDSDLH